MLGDERKVGRAITTGSAVNFAWRWLERGGNLEGLLALPQHFEGKLVVAAINYGLILLFAAGIAFSWIADRLPPQWRDRIGRLLLLLLACVFSLQLGYAARPENQRHLSRPQESHLATALVTSTGLGKPRPAISILFEPNDTEAATFAEEFTRLFSEAGWATKTVEYPVPDEEEHAPEHTIPGLHLVVPEGEHRLDKFIEVSRSTGSQIMVSRVPAADNSDATLWVSRHPYPIER